MQVLFQIFLPSLLWSFFRLASIFKERDRPKRYKKYTVANKITNTICFQYWARKSMKKALQVRKNFLFSK